jgi:hypothetical protein
VSVADTKKKSYNVGKGTTPRGSLIYPHLTTPDTKFKAEGEYRTRFRLDGEEAQQFIEKVDAFYDLAIEKVADERLEDARTKAKDPAKFDAVKNRARILKELKRADKPYKAILDDNGDETGAYAFTFKQKATFKLRTGEIIAKKVDLFDAANKPIAKGVAIYGGTIARIAFEALPFFTPAVGAGLTMRLNAVQVLELKTAGDRDAKSYGFEEEGEGIEQEETPSEETSGDEAGAGDNTDF